MKVHPVSAETVISGYWISVLYFLYLPSCLLVLIFVIIDNNMNMNLNDNGSFTRSSLQTVFFSTQNPFYIKISVKIRKIFSASSSFHFSK